MFERTQLQFCAFPQQLAPQQRMADERNPGVSPKKKKNRRPTPTLTLSSQNMCRKKRELPDGFWAQKLPPKGDVKGSEDPGFKLPAQLSAPLISPLSWCIFA